MNGVEILSSEEIVIDTIFNTKAFWIAFVITLVIAFITCLLCRKIDNWDWSTITIGTVLLGGFLGTLLGFAMGDTVFAIPSKYGIKHKVTISDEVKMNEFLERYDFVSQEGKIYTVIENKKE